MSLLVNSAHRTYPRPPAPLVLFGFTINSHDLRLLESGSSGLAEAAIVQVYNKFYNRLYRSLVFFSLSLLVTAGIFGLTT